MTAPPQTAVQAFTRLAERHQTVADRHNVSDGLDRLKCCSISGIVLEVVGLMYSNSYYYGRMDYYSGWTASFLALLGDSAFVCCTPTLQGELRCSLVSLDRSAMPKLNPAVLQFFFLLMGAGVRSMLCLNLLALGLRIISMSCLIAFSIDIGGEVNGWGYSKHCTERNCFASDSTYTDTGKNRCFEKSKWCRENRNHNSETCSEYEGLWAPFATGEDTMGESFAGFVVEETCLEEAKTMRHEVIGVVKIIVWVAIIMTICIGIIEMTIVGKSWRLLRETGTVVTTTAAIEYNEGDGAAGVVRVAAATPQPVYEAQVEVVGPATETNAQDDDAEGQEEQQLTRHPRLLGFFSKPARQRSRSRSSSGETAAAVELTAVPRAVTVAVPSYLPNHELLPAAVEAYERPARASLARNRSRSRSSSLDRSDSHGSANDGGTSARASTQHQQRVEAPAQNAPTLDGL
jgi:hypothetical protein